MDENNNIVSPDEAQAEQEALAEAKVDEVRAKVVTDLGLTDDDTNKPVIDKLVERELSHKKKLSEAIGQKIKWRDTAKTAKPIQQTQQQQQNTPLDAETIRKQTEATVTASLEQRDLDEMDYSDEIKAEIKRVARVNNTSVRAAEKDPYIQYRITQANATNRNTEAGISPSRKSTAVQSTTIPKFDLSTEEGRKDYDAWKQSKKTE
jgi:hypothetical protein